MTNIQGIVVPNLVIAQRVINKMVAASKHFIADETGEAMIGLVEQGKFTGGIPTIYVLDTIAPDESAEREMYMFVQGDEVQGDILLWLADNWEVQRAHYRKSPQTGKWDTPLDHVGDWHKQPGYMIAPSGGDLGSALDFMDDPDSPRDFLLVPILTIGHESTISNSATNANYLTIPQKDGTSIRIDWWYIQRDVPVFLPITPVIYPDDQLPKFAPYPWHLIDETRTTLEINQLDYDQVIRFGPIQYDLDGDSPLEIAFMFGREGSSKMLLVATEVDYPKSAPRAYLASYVPGHPDDDLHAIFERHWKKAEKVQDPPDWTWDSEKYLIEYLHALEDHLGIPRPKIPTADEIVIRDEPEDETDE
ncbi:MAG: hypothetical protein MUF87_07680 [Anaerolineae bacterium]|nr:hypothetical protein [Anaerolineae bacterium]